MPAPSAAVPLAVKRLLFASLALSVCAPLFGATVDPKIDRAVRDSLPICADSKVKYEELDALRLPARFTGTAVRIESSHPSCEGQLIAVVSPTGGFYLGAPWPLGDDYGKTIEEKLKNFTWRNMQENMTATVDRTRTDDGLLRVTLWQQTENGKLPMEGEIDPEGRVFFFGHFRRLGGDVKAARLKSFEPFLTNMPAKGASNPKVTILEFSDFECPSCKRASGYVDAILAKHHDDVRYVRYDLPLTMHPWAFAASLAGRAIYRQKPDVFWEYKKQVYANQDSMTAFQFWDWARGFAEDHDLDLKRYDADLASEDIKTEILKGAGTAFSTDIRATPTYMVNGVLVDAGDEGKALAEYVDGLVK